MHDRVIVVELIGVTIDQHLCRTCRKKKDFWICQEIEQTQAGI